MKSKNITIEMWRFIASIMILMCHLYYIGVKDGYPFSSTFIFVEFFFILTGYYGGCHFEKSDFSDYSFAGKVKYIYKYDFFKLRYFFHVSAVAIILQYIAEYAFRRNEIGVTFAGFWGQLPFDLLHVSDLFTEPKVVPLWYISVEIIVLPLAFLVFRIGVKWLRMCICIAVPLAYYMLCGVANLRNFPFDYLRGVAGMFLGLLVFDICRIFKKYLYSILNSRIVCVFLHVIGNLLLLMTVCFSFFNLNIMWLYLIFFLTGLICIFLSESVEHRQKNLMLFLGRMSAWIFIWQWVVGTFVHCLDRFVGYFNEERGILLSIRIILYLVITVILAVITELIVLRRQQHSEF